MKAIVPENEAFILSDTNLISIKGTPEYISSLSEDSPTNRIITSLYTKERLLFLLKYGICYKTTTNKDGITEIENISCVIRSCLQHWQYAIDCVKGLEKVSFGIHKVVEKLLLHIQMCDS